MVYDSYANNPTLLRFDFICLCTLLIRGNIDTDRLNKILLECSSKRSIDDVIILAEKVIVCGREDEC